MAKTLQHRRDTTSNLASVTGSIGEIFMDTTKNTLVVMDGSTAGGHPLALEGQGGGGAQGASGATGLTGATGAAGATGPAGGGGGSYDQSLNTTDDVVFNSALVGDVSVIANTVSGLDSYGNADTLIVDGGLTVKYDDQVTTSGSLFSNNSAGFSPSTYGSGTFAFSTNSGWLNSELNTLDDIQPGTVVQFTNLQSSMYGPSTGSFTVVSSSQVVDYYGATQLNLEVSNITVTGGTTMWLGTSGTMSNFNLSWSSTTGSVVDVLDVTGTGVAVTGTLTVNGQAITAGSGAAGATGPAGAAGATGPAGGGGGSYDQSLNTTDDVVFNSALVGDVSIVGNTVSGVDSYGNVDTLIVDGAMQVNFGEVTTTTGPVAINNTTVVNYNGTYIQIAVADGWTQEQVDYFKNMPNNTQINLMDGYTSTYGSYSSGYIMVSYVDTLASDVVNLYVNSININTAGTFTGTPTSIWSQQWYIFNTTITVDTTATVLGVTSTGVDVTGALTVNGTAITTYDQSLNTTDDVVFNSALVSDVSIVANTISGLDSYGNADTLVVDGDLNVNHTTQSTTTLTGLNYSSAQQSSTLNPAAGSEIKFYNQGQMDPSTESTLLALTAGQQITLTDNDSTQRTYTVVGTVYVGGMGGNDVVVYVQEPWGGTYINFPSNGNITVATTTVTTALSVTSTGATVTGDLTVSGDLNLAANATAPGNTSSVVAWAKVVVAGTTYYTPLYQ